MPDTNDTKEFNFKIIAHEGINTLLNLISRLLPSYMYNAFDFKPRL